MIFECRNGFPSGRVSLLFAIAVHVCHSPEERIWGVLCSRKVGNAFEGAFIKAFKHVAINKEIALS